LPLACLFFSFVVAIIAEGAKGVFLAFEIATGDIVEKETLRRRLLLKKPRFNIALLLGQPIQIGIEIIFVKTLQAKDFLLDPAAATSAPRGGNG
jgi:hypothetical protein